MIKKTGSIILNRRQTALYFKAGEDPLVSSKSFDLGDLSTIFSKGFYKIEVTK